MEITGRELLEIAINLLDYFLLFFSRVENVIGFKYMLLLFLVFSPLGIVKYIRKNDDNLI